MLTDEEWNADRSESSCSLFTCERKMMSLTSPPKSETIHHDSDSFVTATDAVGNSLLDISAVKEKLLVFDDLDETVDTIVDATVTQLDDDQDEEIIQIEAKLTAGDLQRISGGANSCDSPVMAVRSPVSPPRSTPSLSPSSLRSPSKQTVIKRVLSDREPDEDNAEIRSIKSNNRQRNDAGITRNSSTSSSASASPVNHYRGSASESGHHYQRHQGRRATDTQSNHSKHVSMSPGHAVIINGSSNLRPKKMGGVKLERRPTDYYKHLYRQTSDSSQVTLPSRLSSGSNVCSSCLSVPLAVDVTPSRAHAHQHKGHHHHHQQKVTTSKEMSQQSKSAARKPQPDFMIDLDALTRDARKVQKKRAKKREKLALLGIMVINIFFFILFCFLGALFLNYITFP